MKKIITVLLAAVIGSAITTSSAMAGQATDALSACLADNTTGKDRKDMARWVFVGMSIHPEIRSLAKVTENTRDEMDRKIAAMFTKLITENCPEQAKSAVEIEGSEAFQSAFGVIGQLAMQELMSNQEVNASFSRFSKYIDDDKINAVIKVNKP